MYSTTDQNKMLKRGGGKLTIDAARHEGAVVDLDAGAAREGDVRIVRIGVAGGGVHKLTAREMTW